MTKKIAVATPNHLLMKAPTCNDCGQPMIPIGGTGKNTQTVDGNGEVRGVREQILYQCHEDKSISIL